MSTKEKSAWIKINIGRAAMPSVFKKYAVIKNSHTGLRLWVLVFHQGQDSMADNLSEQPGIKNSAALSN